MSWNIFISAIRSDSGSNLMLAMSSVSNSSTTCVARD
jgi:hypothetical protein